MTSRTETAKRNTTQRNRTGFDLEHPHSVDDLAVRHQNVTDSEIDTRDVNDT